MYQGGLFYPGAVERWQMLRLFKLSVILIHLFSEGPY